MKRESMFWWAVFVAAESLAGEIDGPALRRLKSAASLLPADEAPERQSAQAGFPFSEDAASEPRRCERGSRRWIRAASRTKLAAPNGAAVPTPVEPNIPLGRARSFADDEGAFQRTVLDAGAIVVGSGMGLFAYAVAAETAGPVGWAAALVFFGGLAVYAAHRRLKQSGVKPSG